MFSDDLVAFWAERHLCTVTTLRADGSPHVVPMGVALDPDSCVAWAITCLLYTSDAADEL